MNLFTQQNKIKCLKCHRECLVISYHMCARVHQSDLPTKCPYCGNDKPVLAEPPSQEERLKELNRMMEDNTEHGTLEEIAERLKAEEEALRTNKQN